MNKLSRSDRKDTDLFGIVNDTYGDIFTKENIEKQLDFQQIISYKMLNS